LIGIIDCGTSSTKLYAVEGEGIVGIYCRECGINDTVRTGSNKLLRDAIKELIYEAEGFEQGQELKLDFLLAAGMITSELGLKAVPHLEAPAGLKELASAVEIAPGKEILGLDIPVVFVRGVKNRSAPLRLLDLDRVDLMRGEEVQAMGLLKKYNPPLPVNILQLGATTKLIHIDEQGRIAGSMTALSGQLYEAMKKGTIVGKCLEPEAKEAPAHYFSEEILDAARKFVFEGGLLRALLLARFSQFALSTEWYERKFFVEAAISADDSRMLASAAKRLGFSLNTPFYVIGEYGRCAIYKHLLADMGIGAKSHIIISEPEDIDSLTVAGCLAVLNAGRERIESACKLLTQN